MLTDTYDRLWSFIEYRYLAAKNVTEQTDRDWLLDEVGTYLRNYCAIVHIPVTSPGITDKDGNPRNGGLFYVWAGLAVDVLRYWDRQNEQAEDGDDLAEVIDASDLSEIKLGDTTIRRGGQLDSTRTNQFNKQHLPDLDSLIYDYRHSMAQFRKVRW